MKQEQFERQGAERWDSFESLLVELESRRRERAAEFPPLYRLICQDLALARDRQFSRSVVERLNRLALQGHQHLYQARPWARRQVWEFVAREFPAAVRAEWRLLLAITLLFYGMASALAWLVFDRPELVHSFLEPAAIGRIEEMYDPDNPRLGVPRDADDSVAMFGFYVSNNIGIAFRTFAAGLVFGIGTLLIVGFNSIHLGVIFGHLTRVGSGTPLYTFVIAHGAFELTAILLAGVAGMRLGLALVSPGDRSRLQALRDAGRAALPIVYGAGLMLLVAAGIEAFWSPHPLPATLKYAVGAGLWALVALYLMLAGRTRAD